MCVRDQALLYYRLLHRGVEETRRVLQGRRSDPSLGVLTGRPAEPVSQWARSFNTLQVVETPSRGSPPRVTFDPPTAPSCTDSAALIDAGNHGDRGSPKSEH